MHPAVHAFLTAYCARVQTNPNPPHAAVARHSYKQLFGGSAHQVKSAVHPFSTAIYANLHTNTHAPHAPHAALHAAGTRHAHTEFTVDA